MDEFHLVRHGRAAFGSANDDGPSAIGVCQSHWLGAHDVEEMDDDPCRGARNSRSPKMTGAPA